MRARRPVFVRNVAVFVASSAICCGAIACGLSVTGSSETADDPEREGGAPTPDGSKLPSDVDVVIDGAPQDAPVDAPVDGTNESGGGCTVLVDDAFAVQSSSWELLSSATFTPGRIDLTPRDNGTRTGAIWWKTPLTFAGMLRVEVDFAIDSTDTTAGHGIAVGWVSTSTPYAIGEAGQSFGLCNGDLDGVAVAADERDDQLLTMSSIEDDCETGGGVTSTTIGASGKLVMELRPDSLTVRYGAISGTRTVSVPKTGYLGITAATGGNNQSGHAITSVRVTSCP